MYIALNQKKERVHISNAKKEEIYYCPICNEEVITRKGSINSHHFAHKNNSKCLLSDGWHYDMSDWHYDWQNQFPIENQEVIFKFNNKIHRADVFINNTVIEFQHSSISESEFNERNDFYKKLGYKVIWVFDAREKDITHRFSYINDNVECSWNNPIKIFNNVNFKDSQLDIYLQIDESIWYRDSNYKSINEYNEININNNILKISSLNDGMKNFSSDDYYSDFEIINNFNPLKESNKNYLYKKAFDFHRLTDEIYNYKIKRHYKFYGYCPLFQEEFYDHTECHACNYIDTRCGRCMYRFRNLKKDRVSEIIEIKYDKEGRVIFVKLKFDDKVKDCKLEELPYNTRTIVEFARKKMNVKVARFINTNTSQIIQVSGYNLRNLIKINKCIGKLCFDSDGVDKATSKEYEIYDWNKPIWLLIWFVE